MVDLDLARLPIKAFLPLLEDTNWCEDNKVSNVMLQQFFLFCGGFFPLHPKLHSECISWMAGVNKICIYPSFMTLWHPNEFGNYTKTKSHKRDTSNCGKKLHSV